MPKNGRSFFPASVSYSIGTCRSWASSTTGRRSLWSSCTRAVYPALWSLDHSYEGFQWVDNISDNPCVFGYTRTDGTNSVLVALNFSDAPAKLRQMDNLNPIFATDAAFSADTLPPYGGAVFACTKE